MDHPIPSPGQLRRPGQTVPAGAVVTAAIVELAPPGGAGADGRVVAAAAMTGGRVVYRSVTVAGADAAAEVCGFDAVLEQEREHREAQAHAEAARHRDVYTDGSVSATRIGCGAAAVGDDGRVHTRVVEDLPNRPVLAELLAIEPALQTYPNRRLTVHTDSRDAIRLLTADPDRRRLPRESAAVVTRARAIARRVDELGRDRSVHLVWIRGHAGHPFNEAADRAAKAARRTRSFRMDPAALDAVLGNIDQDLRPLVA